MRLLNMRYTMIDVIVKLAIWTSFVTPGLASTAGVLGHFGM